MYHDTLDTKIYSQVLNTNQEESPILSSLVERCRNPDQKQLAQIDWNQRVSHAVSSIVEVNPYLANTEYGEEVVAGSAIAWLRGRNADCRPKLFDGITQTWKLCDTGSMVTVVKRGSEDKVDKTKILKAVNGSSINCYGQKEIFVRLNRKSYPIMATIADIEQDIIGWDFISKHKLNFEWNEFGDLVLHDRKANIKSTLKCVSMPVDSLQTAYVQSLRQSYNIPNKAEAFEVASMKLLAENNKVNEINPKYQQLINKFPEILKPSFQELSTKHGVTQKFPPSRVARHVKRRSDR